MNNQPQFSNVTKEYLATFQCILDKMICQMIEAQLSNSISSNFIVQMIPHHRAAIEMCRNLLQYTTFIPLQDIAQNIITEQTRSIENMCSIQSSCQQCVNYSQDVRAYQQKANAIMQRMFTRMQQACPDNDINICFIREMIPHHEGAIALCENALCCNLCPGLIPILESIITSQRQGVCQMRQLLECL